MQADGSLTTFGRMRWVGVAGLFLLLACRQSDRVIQTGGDGGVSSVGPDSGQPDPDGGGPATPDGGVDAGTDGGTDATLPRYPGNRAGYVNPIPGENQRAGDPGWRSGFSSPYAAQIEGFADRVSANAGDTVNLMVRSDATRGASWTLYRIGWYGGAGARALSSGTTQVAEQPACPENHSTGLITCPWTPTFSVTIPRDAVSGLFLVRVVRSDNFGILIPLIVKDQRPADLYFQSSVTTWQAYNDWHGEDLYDSDDNVAGGFAVQVSFDRPYQSDDGSGQMLRYEALMARFLERNGYDVSYTTNLDVAREGANGLLARGAFLSVGHDEYWPGEERDAVETARDQGLPLFFFGANAAYWKVRLSSPGADGNPRTITCYKKNPAADPLYNTPQQTGRFRDPPINRPEEALVGTMYESWLLFGQPWTVMGSNNPMYDGTNLHDGDTLPQLVGYEYDRTFSGGTPSPVTVVSHSPLVDAEGKPGYSEAVMYTAPSGAFVFGAGSIYWAQGVDGPLRDARIERMTANLLAMGRGLPVPSALKTVTGNAPALPDPLWATQVSTVAKGMPGPAGVAQLPDGSFVVADARAHRIWQVTATGQVSPYAGDGNPTGSPSYDNVPALQARFFQPTAVLADPAGNVYVADTHNDVIRKICNDANHTVVSVAGSFMVAAYADGVGSAARFNLPMGMAWLDATHIVIADSANMALRVLDLTTRAVTTLAITHWGDDVDGPAATATFYYPTAVTVAPDGRVFFLASSTGKLKMIGTDAAHTITTLVAGGIGFADGPGNGAMLQPQAGLLWYGPSSVLVADSANQRVRMVTIGSSASTTRVQTWAGSGQMGAGDGPAKTASFEVPLGMTRGTDGNVYVVDGVAGTLRAIKP